MDKKKKKPAAKESAAILKILIPDHLKKINENSGWCGTVKPDAKKLKKKKSLEL